MDPQWSPEDGNGASSSSTQQSPPPPLVRRRVSMDEDFLYQTIMSNAIRPPSNPPPYEAARPGESVEQGGSSSSGRMRTRSGEHSTGARLGDCAVADEDENLPTYFPSIEMEGVFTKKHEIENTTKRAEDRHWHTQFVTLNGTALNIYQAKKNWGWGRTRDGPSISPDNPPWMRKGKLEKTYSLLHADAGIAADYKKRRYVIRVRAEEDQFLLCCIELETFVKWLEALFAAIDLAAPIDDRDFPRDMSIPRIQRIRWHRGQSPVRIPSDMDEGDTAVGTAGTEVPSPSRDESRPRSITRRRRSSTPEALPVPEALMADERLATRLTAEELPDAPEVSHEPGQHPGSIPHHPPRIDPQHRLSTSSYPNPAINPHSGKWFPENNWTSAHDLLYAKLCYSNLLFRSPRKSNYIISKGKQWFVDWSSGRMVRVLPPAYGEVDWFGPWQVVHTENRRI